MMDKIFVKDLLVRGIIGVTARERSQPQDILVNIILFADIARAGTTDDIKKSVNYRTVAKAIIAHIEETQRRTVEALVTDIAKICLDMPGVEKVRARVEKPGAVRFAKSAGVEIVRTKKDGSS
jgi:FolB domain-containing protein